MVDFSTRVSKSVFLPLRVSMTSVIIVYYGLPSKMQGDDDIVGKAPQKFKKGYKLHLICEVSFIQNSCFHFTNKLTCDFPEIIAHTLHLM